MRLSLRTKRARELIADIDYLAQLDEQARAWFEVYFRAVANLETDAIAVLAGADNSQLRQQLFNEDRAQRRDVMYIGSRMDMDELLANGPGPASCPHCCKAECKCAPRKRHSRYSQADYYR